MPELTFSKGSHLDSSLALMLANCLASLASSWNFVRSCKTNVPLRAAIPIAWSCRTETDFLRLLDLPRTWWRSYGNQRALRILSAVGDFVSACSEVKNNSRAIHFCKMRFTHWATESHLVRHGFRILCGSHAQKLGTPRSFSDGLAHTWNNYKRRLNELSRLSSGQLKHV